MEMRSKEKMVGTFIGILCIFLAVGCASTGTYLKWNQIDTAAFLRSDPAKQAYNAIRYETFGPKAEQLIGYFLYKDGIEVVTGEGIPVTRMGKKTLDEITSDYNSVRKARMETSGSNLILREVYRRDAVVGYTASDINIDVQIWDITQGDGPAVLRLVYKDRRKEGEPIEMRRPTRNW
ncbi:MAG: hypothetical protein ACM34C_08150 [Syntrophaceae bacterium]